MSDHRYLLKVEFSIYGETFTWDTSLNWDPNEPCDPRIPRWFAVCYEDARAKWNAENMMAERMKAVAEIEARERAELARLLAKYPDRYRGFGMRGGDANASPGSYPLREWFAPPNEATD